jgi:outer membrane scaffolding protein for murein synthesis (MipA/OmpV family)
VGRLPACVVAAILAIVVSGPDAAGQLPGLPVLQNAFVGPGFAAALNVGGGGDGTTYAAALGWAPRSARFQVSVGAGALVADGATGGAFGARVAVPIFTLMKGNLGIAAFGGLGGAQGPKVQDGRVGLGQAPVGAAVGYRRAIGATRGFSVYAAPFFAYFRSDFGNSTQSAGLFRISIGGDFALTRAIGLTAGLEAGGSRRANGPGPDGVIWGAGVSYAVGRR